MSKHLIWVQLHSEYPGPDGDRDVVPLPRRSIQAEDGKKASVDWTINRRDGEVVVRYLTFWSDREGGTQLGLPQRVNRVLKARWWDTLALTVTANIADFPFLSKEPAVSDSDAISEDIATKLLDTFTGVKLSGYKDDNHDVIYHYRSNEAAARRAVDTLERWLVENGHMIMKMPDWLRPGVVKPPNPVVVVPPKDMPHSEVYVGEQRGLPERIGGPDQPGVTRRLGGSGHAELEAVRIEALRLAEILHVDGTDTRGWPPYRILTEVVIPAAREAMDMTRSQEAVLREVTNSQTSENTYSVQPGWCRELPLQQQSVLLLAARGPDGIRKDHPIKDIVRAYRGTVLVAAKYGRELRFVPLDPAAHVGDSFMDITVLQDRNFDPWMTMIEKALDAIDDVPHHYVMHLAHGAEILGYTHPDQDIRKHWNYFYAKIVDSLHLIPETSTQMDDRLNDWDRRAW